MKEGPCHHCGIAYTPLWRNGPPEKPVLCNACGSRWRTKSTLDDYIPKHAANDNQGKMQSIEAETTEPYFSFVSFGNETTNRSSFAFTASSETCVHTEKRNGLDEISIRGRESIPKRKRSVLNQYVLSPVDRLHKDLLQLMYQQQDSTEPAEEDDLIHGNTNIFSSFPETVYGAMLLKSPNPEMKESKIESFGTEKESKPESPMSLIKEIEIKSESPIMATDIKPVFPLDEKETKSESPTTETDIKPESSSAEKKNSAQYISP